MPRYGRERCGLGTVFDSSLFTLRPLPIGTWLITTISCQGTGSLHSRTAARGLAAYIALVPNARLRDKSNRKTVLALGCHFCYRLGEEFTQKRIAPSERYVPVGSQRDRCQRTGNPHGMSHATTDAHSAVGSRWANCARTSVLYSGLPKALEKDQWSYVRHDDVLVVCLWAGPIE